MPVTVQESLWKRGSAVACCRVGGTECCDVCTGPFDRGPHYPHYLHHSLVSGQTTGREHSPTHQQKIEWKIYWAWPRPSEQDPVSPSISLSHQEASINLLSLSIRGQTECKPQSQKTNQTDHMDHTLSNSVKPWGMPCRPTKDGRVMVEYSDKMWSTGEGNGKPLQYSRLENPITVWKVYWLGSKTKRICPLLRILGLYCEYSQSYGFSSSHVWMWELDHKKGWAPKNCCFELRCWRRLLRISCTARFKPVNLKGNKPWIFFGRTDAEADLIFLATWCKELTYWKSPWCWERLKTGGEGDDRGWDGWMASPTQWTWVWANSGR